MLRAHITTGSRSTKKSTAYLIYFGALSIAGSFSDSAGTYSHSPESARGRLFLNVTCTILLNAAGHEYLRDPRS